MKTVYIKNMVCDRCISSVKQLFTSFGYVPLNIALGEVVLDKDITKTDLSNIEKLLKIEGFEHIDSTTPILVNKIKSALITLFENGEISEEFKLSAFLTEKFPYDYSHLSRIFSQHEKDTIEHYLIKLRIEKAKELLSYNDQNVSEIAYMLGYSSAAHFSRQFKKLVGLSPSKYKINPSIRKSIGHL
jgi:AraC-like DNA-binding protein